MSPGSSLRIILDIVPLSVRKGLIKGSNSTHNFFIYTFTKHLSFRICFHCPNNSNTTT